MNLCDRCGQWFLIELDSCPLCNQRKRNTVEAKKRLRGLIDNLKKQDLEPEFLKQLESINVN